MIGSGCSAVTVIDGSLAPGGGTCGLKKAGASRIPYVTGNGPVPAAPGGAPISVLPTAAAELATAVASKYGAPRKLCGPTASAKVLAAAYTTDASVMPASVISPTACRLRCAMLSRRGPD